MRTIGVFLILAVSAHAEEGAVVSFDPREDPQLVLDWRTLVLGILMCLVVIVFCRLVAKGIRRNAARFRYWLPTGMIVMIWTAFLVADSFQLSESSFAGGILLAIGVVIALINLPLIPVVLGFSILVDLVRLPPLLTKLMATVVAWWSWYAIVRFLERRARMNAIVSLNIGNVRPSLFDVAQARGVIGIAKGLPPDLSTNPKHFEGFGEK